MTQMLQEDNYAPGSQQGSAFRSKRPTDDQSHALRATAGDPASNVRNKSSIPKRVTDAESGPDKNPFSTNNNPKNMKLLGFGNDFLAYNPEPKGQASNEEIRVAARNPYENLDDIDFRSNTNTNPFESDNNPFKNPRDQPPSFGNFRKNSLEKSPRTAPNEPNLLDL